jgi:hypothetical protein
MCRSRAPRVPGSHRAPAVMDNDPGTAARGCHDHAGRAGSLIIRAAGRNTYKRHHDGQTRPRRRRTRPSTGRGRAARSWHRRAGGQAEGHASQDAGHDSAPPGGPGAGGETSRRPPVADRGLDHRVRRVDELRLPSHRAVHRLDAVHRVQAVAHADADRVAGSDLPVHVRHDRPEPAGGLPAGQDAVPVIARSAAYRCRRCPGGRPRLARCPWTVWTWRCGPPHPVRRSPPPAR